MNLNNVDFNKLAVFSKVVEEGGYRLASEALNVTPSALSQTIASLEHSLGIPLFHRIGKKLVPTEDGKRIQREFKRHHGNFTEALREIAGKAGEVEGLIRVGAYVEFAKHRLAPKVAEFQKKHSNAQIKFVFDTPTRLQRSLESGKIDVCFSIYPERGTSAVVSKPIYREELLLLSLRGTLSEKAGFDEIARTPMIEYYFNHQPMRRWLLLHFKKKPKDLPIRTYGASAEMVLALVQQGLGIGVVPEYLLQEEIGKNIAVCRPTPRKLVDHIWMLKLKNRHSIPALDVFTQEIERGFAASNS